MPTDRRSERARYMPALPGIQRLALGKAGMEVVQLLVNTGHSSVTARGSILNDGLLMNPMKWSKLWLPLSPQFLSGVLVPSGINGTSFGSAGASMGVASDVGPVDPTKRRKLGSEVTTPSAFCSGRRMPDWVGNAS